MTVENIKLHKLLDCLLVIFHRILALITLQFSRCPWLIFRLCRCRRYGDVNSLVEMNQRCQFPSPIYGTTMFFKTSDTILLFPIRVHVKILKLPLLFLLLCKTRVNWKRFLWPKPVAVKNKRKFQNINRSDTPPLEYNSRIRTPNITLLNLYLARRPYSYFLLL